MKLRNPREFAAALTEIRSALGEAACAQAVGRSTSLIRKWSDPDHPALPNIAQALQLDSAFVAAGKGEPPLWKLYEKLLEEGLNTDHLDGDDIVPSALMLHAIVGELSEVIRACIPQDGNPYIKLSPSKQATLLNYIDRLEDEACRLEDAVEASGV
tara:strand:- start:351 stop:818 length:468 start_codon:yes stop_codon:yes gene_type:complete